MQNDITKNLYNLVCDLNEEFGKKDKIVAAAQFTISIEKSKLDLETYSYFTTSDHENYENLLDEFIKNNGSLILMKPPEEPKHEVISRATHEVKNYVIAEKKRIPIRNDLSPADWNTWCKFLKDKKYGNHVFWYSKKDETNKYRFDVFIVLIKALYLIKKKKLKKPRKLFDAVERFLFHNGPTLVIDTYYKTLIENATRAAISQVMARNMSHNIGSHVLSRMVDTSKIISFITEDKKSKDQYKGFEFNNEFAAKPENLIQSFNSYLKSRMDFLADITTGVPTIENSKWLYKELMSGLDKNRLLLNRISGIDNFHFHFVLINKLNETQLTIISEKNDKYYRYLNDMLISMPNDILGFHAFYLIIENIIRNSAKHGKPDKIKDPVFTIEIQNCNINNELYEIVVYDNIPISGTHSLSSEEKTEYDLRIDKIDSLKFLVHKQNHILNKSVLSSGKLRQGGWGLIEMDSAAAYLRKIPVENIDSDEYDIDACDKASNKLSILKALSVDNKYLGYKFYVYKPREILIIDELESFKSINADERKQLLQWGILICDKSSDDPIFKYNPKNIYNHKLVVLNSKDSAKIINENSTGLSNRIFIINAEQNEYEVERYLELINKNMYQDFIEELWLGYLKSMKYKFFIEYNLTFDDKLIKYLNTKNDRIKQTAKYLDHGDRWSDECANSCFVEIKYSAVEGLLPNIDFVLSVQYIDSIHSKILVIDERIQEQAENGEYTAKGDSKIKYMDIYNKTNIIVPSSDKFNLNDADFDESFDKIIKYLKTQEADFYIVHLGIIEKLIESYNRKEENREGKYDKNLDIEKFSKDILFEQKFDYRRIIIISGRGTPHNLPKSMKYLNYSIVSQYLIELRFKYLFTEAVFSARRT